VSRIEVAFFFVYAMGAGVFFVKRVDAFVLGARLVTLLVDAVWKILVHSLIMLMLVTY
jgi:hypothetical protein